MTRKSAPPPAHPDDLTETHRYAGEFAPELAGERLDKALATMVREVSRVRIRALVTEGRVRLDDRTIDDPRHRVKPGQRFAMVVADTHDQAPEPEALALDIVHEDEAVLVLNKPAGLVVHPAAGHAGGTLVNALLAHCGPGLPRTSGADRPGIVHRLDKDTSGLMVVAKTEQAHDHLVEQFADRTLSRTYVAVVWGVPTPREGTIDAAVGRHPRNRKRMAVVTGDKGKPAVTHYRVVRPLGPHMSLVECRLETGRTHQIRVHLAHIGHPVLGDTTYGGRFQRRVTRLPEAIATAVGALDRQALHACELRFRHPLTNAEQVFTIGLPRQLKKIIDTLE